MDKSGSSFRNGGFLFSVTVTVYVIISFGMSFLLRALFTTESFIYKALVPLASVISIAGVLLFFNSRNGVDFTRFTRLKKFSPAYLLLAVLLSVSMFFALGFSNGVVTGFLESINLAPNEISLGEITTLNYVVYVVTWAILPAFFEEIFLRGGVFYRVRKKHVLGVALTSGLLFFCFHMSLAQTVYQFFYGVFLYLLTAAARSVIPAIISHFLNNFAVLTLSYLKINLNMLNPVFIICGWIGLIAFTVITLLLLKSHDKKHGKRLFDSVYVYGGFGIIICIIVMISGLFA